MCNAHREEDISEILYQAHVEEVLGILYQAHEEVVQKEKERFSAKPREIMQNLSL
jgi:hypothetical protein